MERVYKIKKSELISLVSEMFSAGFGTSKYCPNPTYDKLKAFKGSDIFVSLLCSLTEERQLEIKKIKYLDEIIHTVLEESGEVVE